MINHNFLPSHEINFKLEETSRSARPKEEVEPKYVSSIYHEASPLN